MILLIDNYDSFTYNLAQSLGQLGSTLEVQRNDQITLDEIAALKPERIVISPGPGVPQEAGISVELIRRFAGKIPILGVCLGRSEEHTSELQSRPHLVCRLLLEKKKTRLGRSRCRDRGEPALGGALPLSAE